MGCIPAPVLFRGRFEEPLGSGVVSAVGGSVSSCPLPEVADDQSSFCGLDLRLRRIERCYGCG